MDKGKFLFFCAGAVVAFITADILAYKPVNKANQELQQQLGERCHDLLQLITETERDPVVEQKNGVLEGCVFSAPLG